MSQLLTPHWIVCWTSDVLVGLPGDAPISCSITKRSKPFATIEAAEHFELLMRRAKPGTTTKIVPE